MKANRLPQELTWGNVTNAKTTASNLKLERIAIMQCSIADKKTAFREAEFDCPECGKLFTSKSALNRHKKKENSERKNKIHLKKSERPNSAPSMICSVSMQVPKMRTMSISKMSRANQRTASSMRALMR